MTVETPIRYWNRREGRDEEERVWGGRALRWLYGSRAGRVLLRTLLVRRWVSRFSGWWPSTRWSRRRIASFVREFDIPVEEFEREDWRTFNDFFARRFRPGARPFPSNPGAFPAFAEGRYLALERVDAATALPVKGLRLSPAEILGGVPESRSFEGGPAFVARLCPLDYHRFHYPDDGRTLRSWRIPGPLDSVNPVALRVRGDILVRNERRASILETRRWGRLAYVEVGALQVGRIVQTHPEDRPFTLGAEKGHFLFGGSTVVVLGEADRWRPAPDLLARTRDGQETLVRLGEDIGRGAAAPAGAPPSPEGNDRGCG